MISEQVPLQKHVPLGRLKSLGVMENYLAPFLFPREYVSIDSDQVISDFSQLVSRIDDKVYIRCSLMGSPTIHQDPNNSKKPLRTHFYVTDGVGHQLSISIFGQAYDLGKKLRSHPVIYMEGKVGVWNNLIQLGNVEFIDPKWIGAIQPIYPGKTKKISPETVAERMPALVERYLDEAVAFLREKFSLEDSVDEKQLLQSLGGSRHNDIAALIKSIHAPSSIEEGNESQLILKRLAALDILNHLGKTNTIANPESSLNIDPLVIKKLAKEIPGGMTPTRDQSIAINQIFNDIRSQIPMRRLLTGDVGTGKSLPIAIMAAAVARHGKNAIILMPNEPLAEQMRADIEFWWPDTQPKLVAGSTKGLPESKILVGTTALNFRVPDDYPVHLLIIDEQQRMSVEQRLTLARPYTNVLEASATPLPRSLALITYGGLPISTLKKAYVEKDISTRMVFNKPDERKALFLDIKKTISDGYQALIIYPLAETAEIDEEITEGQRKADLKSAEGAFKAWENHFPGRVSHAHGKMSSSEKMNNIGALNKGEADILCSTTVVEVGLNIPNLRYVLIVHPERLGLATLHQIRGRLCRNGGTGNCVLYFPDKVSEKTMQRLKVFEKLSDGFLIASADMRMRGIGDLIAASENEQSGQIDISFLPSQQVSIEEFEWAVENPLTPRVEQPTPRS